MKLQKLNFPYSNDYLAGYVIINKENRRTIVLKDNNGKLHSTQYARYLLSCKIGRYLTSKETVDHIDGNKMNDNINNLCILTRAENIRKSSKKREHGHSSMIKSGCKCQKCCDARKEWNNKYINKHREEINARRRMKRKEYSK